MKILHITNNLWSGGVTTFLVGLLNYLVNENEITLVLLGTDDEPYLKEKFDKRVKIIFLNQKKIYNPKSILKLRKIIKENDIVHTHLFPALYFGFFSSLLLKKKLITTEHAAYNNRRKYKMFRYIDKIIYKGYDTIIPCSYGVEKTLSRWLGIKFKNKIKTIPNGILLEEYERLRSKTIINIEKNEKLICMVARFSKQKDQKTLLDAMKLLPRNIKCLFIGIGEELENVKNYFIEIEKEIGKNRVFFLGYRKDAVEIIKGCDVTVLSSFYEGLPLVILESLAVGVPVIGTNIEGIKEVLKKEELIFEVGNSTELSFKLRNLLENPILLEKIKEEIKLEIANYDLKKMLIEYAKIYIN